MSDAGAWYCARCAATLTCAIPGQPSCPYCQAPMDGDPLADTETIAYLVKRPESTIRSWAQKGDLIRRGTGERKRALYSIREATELAQQRKLDNHADQRQH